jgi:hypothetical protein
VLVLNPVIAAEVVAGVQRIGAKDVLARIAW